MHYLIDGYNLLFRNLRAVDSLQKQRNELIADIAAKAELLHLDATIVFDSHYQPSESSKHHLGALEIIYTNPGETADEFILKSLKDLKKPSKTTVVTSDKILANHSRMRLAQSMTIDEFLHWINRRKKNIAAQKKQEAPTILRPLIKPTPPPTPEKIETEQPKKHTLDDYEKIFTQSLHESDKILHTKRVEKKVAKGKKNPPKKKDDADKIESDMARWMEAFEKRSKET